jgi:hypothetical protein
MPYADPEKRREVKRKYEQEKRKQRRTNWMLVFYEDQCPEWREELDELGMPTLVSPSHDADEWTERDEKKNPKHKAGTLKEPHRHLLAMYDNPVSYDQVVKDFAFLKSKNVKYVKSLPAMARYLTHMDSPDKAQYDPEGVCEFGGADWRDLCATTSDKHLALREMRAFIRENNVVDFYLFWDWCDEHNDEWSRLLDDSCCYAIEHYMRSSVRLRWSRRRIAKRCVRSAGTMVAIRIARREPYANEGEKNISSRTRNDRRTGKTLLRQRKIGNGGYRRCHT